MSAYELLKAIGLGAEGDASCAILDFVEHETRTYPLPDGKSEAILDDALDLLSGAISVGLLSVESRRDVTGATRLVVETSSVIGFASSSSSRRDGRVFVRVRPKVGTTRMLELAVLAGMLPRWQVGGAHVSPTLEEALIEWMIGAFDEALRRLLARGGLRNTHERVRADLKNRMRGRLLVGPWLRNISRGKPHLVSSEFPSLEFDNSANRMLRWAIHAAITVARTIPTAAHIEARLRQVERQFAGVALIRPRTPLIDSRALPANLRHYAEAIELSRLVLAGVHLGSSPGDIEAMSIALDMNKIYELAFFNGFSAIRPDASRHEEWRIRLETPRDAPQERRLSRSTRMIPDVWVDGDASRLPVVIETKWKSVLSRVPGSNEAADLLTTGETKTIRLRPEDLYQATAYALEVLHRRSEKGELAAGCVVALIYPSLGDVPDLGRDIHIGAVRVMVRIVGWNVVAPISHEIKTIWARLLCAAEPEPVVVE